MHNRKAPGPDGVCNEFLKHLGPVGRRLLLELLNDSWRTGQVPADWRRAEIVPILKKGKDKNAPASYRPVALTSCVAKVFERMIKLRLQHHLEASGALPHEQAGFRWGRSTTEQIVRVTQDVLDGFAGEQYTLMLLVDFSRYFDRIWKVELFERLLGMAVPAQAVRWMSSFFGDRTAHVRCGPATSQPRTFEEGLAQGTVLAPLLSAAYAADLPAALKGGDGAVRVSLFADDVAATAASLEECQQRMQAVLDRLQRWAEARRVEVSLEKGKTEYTVFTPSPAEARRFTPEAPPLVLRYGEEALLYAKTPGSSG